VHIFLDDSCGNANKFGVGAVIEEQVRAKVFLIPLAIKALPAGRRVCGYDTLPDPEILHAGAYRDDVSRELMTEQSRRLDHSRVITSAKHFYVGPAGQGSANSHQNVTRLDLWDVNGLNAQLLFPVQYRCGHALG
jgi:hypothetical protein